MGVGEGSSTGRGQGEVQDVRSDGSEPDESNRRRRSSRRLHSDQPRKNTARAKYNDGEWVDIVAAADRTGVSPAAFVALAGLAAARGTEVPGSPLREAMTELMQARTAVVRIGQAVNKLAAQALSVGGVTAQQLESASVAARRVVRRVEDATSVVERAIR